MKNLKYLLIIGITFLTQISNAQKTHYIKSGNYEGVVFANYPFIPFEGSNHPYIPSNSEIATMEKKISQSIDKLISIFKKQHDFFEDRCDIPRNLNKYKRHYFGYWYKNNKIINVYFFNADKKDWNRGMFLIEDGGCSYFRLSYSINTGILYNLSFGSF